MLRYLVAFAFTAFLSSGMAFAQGVLTDADIPDLQDALRKTYNLDMCHKDLPNATVQTCECLGDAMAKNLDATKLKICQKEGYDDCVAAEFSAAKASLTEKQINDCKALTKAEPEEADESEADA